MRLRECIVSYGGRTCLERFDLLPSIGAYVVLRIVEMLVRDMSHPNATRIDASTAAAIDFS